jgi:hypothetical protein
METTESKPETTPAMSENRRDLIEYLSRNDQLINNEKVDLIFKLLSLNWPTKTELMKLSGFDTSKCYDTALPCDDVKRIREIFPDFDNGCYVYDYSQPGHSFGVYLNIYNLFAKHILQTLNVYK